MNAQRTLQTLPLECLIQIVSNLSLPECLELRTFCRQLKAAVDDHFRFVDRLPITLSLPSSPAAGLGLETYYRRRNLVGFYQFREVTFGSAALPHRCLTLLDNDRILHGQNRHFRRDDFLILRNTPANIDSFVEFITKYLPKVSKLAFLIDYNEGEHRIFERIVEIYRPKLKVLSLERTGRSCWRRPAPGQPTRNYRFEMSTNLCDFIEGIEGLEELYLFPKKHTKMNIIQPHTVRFVSVMLSKLKVFHINFSASIPLHYTSQEVNVNETLKELFCNWDWKVLRDNNIVCLFPALKKYISPGYLLHYLEISYEPCMPNLETFHFNGTIEIRAQVMEKLNMFTQLKHLRCYGIHSPGTIAQRLLNKVDPNIPINNTIKHLEIDALPMDGLPVVAILHEVRRSMPYFDALETITVREPYLKLTVDELDDWLLARQ